MFVLVGSTPISSARKLLMSQYLCLFLLFLSIASSQAFVHHIDKDKISLRTNLNNSPPPNPHLLSSQIFRDLSYLRTTSEITENLRSSQIFKTATIFGAVLFQEDILPESKYKVPFTKTQQVYIKSVGEYPPRLIKSAIYDHVGGSKVLRTILSLQGIVKPDDKDDDDKDNDSQRKYDQAEDGIPVNDNFDEDTIPSSTTSWPIPRRFIKSYKYSDYDKNITSTRRDFVRSFIEEAWNSYALPNPNDSLTTSCFGKPAIFYQPGINNDLVNCAHIEADASTLVEAISTLNLAGFDVEFARAVNYTASLKVESSEAFPVLSLTNMYLGSMLSAYEDAPTEELFAAMVDMGEKLMLSSAKKNDTSGFYPSQMMIFIDASYFFDEEYGHAPVHILSELSGIQVEFTRLTQITNDTRYQTYVDNIYTRLFEHEDKFYGFLPNYLLENVEGKLTKYVKKDGLTLGSNGAAYLSYLLRMWLLTGRVKEEYRKRFEKSVALWIDKAYQCYFSEESEEVGRSQVCFIADLAFQVNSPTSAVVRISTDSMEVEKCGFAGTLALGVMSGAFAPEDRQTYLDIAKNITKTCVEAYSISTSKISPRVFSPLPNGTLGFAEAEHVKKEGINTSIYDHHIFETLYILYRATGDRFYRNTAFDIINTIYKVSKRTDKNGRTGFFPLEDVNDTENHKDKEFRFVMHPRFIGATLKFAYLIFQDESDVELDTHVFTLHGHPLRFQQFEA